MPRFFVPAASVSSGRARIEGADAAHLARSLRARRGERVVIVDDSGMEHGVVLDEVTGDLCAGTVEWTRPSTGEPGRRISVLQALAREGMDEAVEALAEAGAAEIWPVITERTVPRPDQRRAVARLIRWQATAREAAGLAGRGALVAVHELMPLDQALAAVQPGRVLALTTTASTPLATADIGRSEPIALVVGPEGGLGPADIAELHGAGAMEVHLGPRVLRTRLAGAVALGVLLARAGELDTAPVFSGSCLA